MRPVVVSSSGVSTSPLIALDYVQTPFNVGLGTVVTGTVTYTIQHTFDDIYALNFNPATANWYNHDDAVFVAATANANSNFAYPVRACRINQTAGTGGVALTALQGIQY